MNTEIIKKAQELQATLRAFPRRGAETALLAAIALYLSRIGEDK